MKVYLIFGVKEHYGNEIFLSGVATTLKNAQKIAKKTTFWNQSFDELNEITKETILIPEHIGFNEPIDFDSCGIYEIGDD